MVRGDYFFRVHLKLIASPGQGGKALIVIFFHLFIVS